MDRMLSFDSPEGVAFLLDLADCADGLGLHEHADGFRRRAVRIALALLGLQEG